MHTRQHSKRPTLTDARLDKLLLSELKDAAEPTPKELNPCLLASDFAETVRSRFPSTRRPRRAQAFAEARAAFKRLEARGYADCVDEMWTLTKKGARA